MLGNLGKIFKLTKLTITKKPESNSLLLSGLIQFGILNFEL